MPDVAIREQVELLVSTILDGATAWHLDGSFVHEVGPLVEDATTHAKSAEQLLIEAFAPDRARLLDFGCGGAHHRSFIESIGYRWSGVDNLDTVSPAARAGVSGLHGQITLYDGTTLPYADGVFDVVYAMLVLHHVQHVDLAFAEIARVLADGGRLIGQISSMEQIQDYSTFNFTPFGLKVACQGAGLHLDKVHPKHDAFSFLLRRLMITLGASDDNELTAMLDPGGFVHERIIATGRRLGRSDREINLLRLKFCTQFVFAAERNSCLSRQR